MKFRKKNFQLQSCCTRQDKQLLFRIFLSKVSIKKVRHFYSNATSALTICSKMFLDTLIDKSF